MSYEDTVKALKVVSTLALGNYAGASLYTAIAVQPSLIEQPDVHNAAKVMRSILRKSFIMPISVLISSSSALAVYYKTRGTSLEDPYWLFSGSLMLGIIPYSASLIGPINLKFQDLNETFSDDEKWSELFTDWLTFHSPRAAVACALFSVGIYKLICE